MLIRFVERGRPSRERALRRGDLHVLASKEALFVQSRDLIAARIADGELPAWLDVDALTRGFLGLLDGLLLQRVEMGDTYRPADLQRRAGAVIELLLAAAGAPRPDLPRPPVPSGAVEAVGAVPTA